MSCPPPPAADNCDPKCFCRVGECANQPFPCDNPCPENCTWRGCGEGCDCPEGIGRAVFITYSRNNFGYDDGPMDNFYIGLPDPYFDQDGDLITIRFTVSNNWSGQCDGGSIYDCLDFTGTVTGTKVTECYGGGSYWLSTSLARFRNGEWDGFEWGSGIRSASGPQCGENILGASSSATFIVKEVYA